MLIIQAIRISTNSICQTKRGPIGSITSHVSLKKYVSFSSPPTQKHLLLYHRPSVFPPSTKNSPYQQEQQQQQQQNITKITPISYQRSQNQKGTMAPTPLPSPHLGIGSLLASATAAILYLCSRSPPNSQNIAHASPFPSPSPPPSAAAAAAATTATEKQDGIIAGIVIASIIGLTLLIGALIAICTGINHCKKARKERKERKRVKRAEEEAADLQEEYMRVVERNRRIDELGVGRRESRWEKV